MSYYEKIWIYARLLVSLLPLLSSIPFQFATASSNSGTISATHVSCGSAIKLTHVSTGGEYVLSSNNNHNWGGGSGQQIVTLVSRKEVDSSSVLWQVREGHNSTNCITGSALQCGQIIRLTHLGSQKNLHTQLHIPSAISFQQEVSGFGEKGEGDHGDDWRVLCSGKRWRKGQTVRLQHVITGAYMAASKKYLFDERNCRSCPILNHLEVAGTNNPDDTTNFQARSGVFISL